MLFPGLCIYFADVALRAGQMNNLTPLHFQNLCKEDTVLTVQMAPDKVGCQGAHAQSWGCLEGVDSRGVSALEAHSACVAEPGRATCSRKTPCVLQWCCIRT